MAFKKAEKQQLWLRMALHGGPGSGKTVSSILIASGIGNRIAVIDTENRSAEKATRDFPVEFDVSYLSDYHPHNYIKEIQTAVKEGYDVLIIDSLSHAWVGKGGVLEVVEQAKEKNQFTAWAKGTPLQNDLIDAIIQAPIHIIATMRSKEKYVIEKNEYGKDVPRKIGVEPIQRDGMYYEFDVCGRFDEDLNLIVEKSRALFLRNKTVHKPTAEFGGELKEWLLQGKPVPKPFVCAAELKIKLTELNSAASEVGLTVDDLKAGIAVRIGSDDLRSFDDEKMKAALDVIGEMIANAKALASPGVAPLALVPPVEPPSESYPTAEDMPDTAPKAAPELSPRENALYELQMLTKRVGFAIDNIGTKSFIKALLQCEVEAATDQQIFDALALAQEAESEGEIISWAAQGWNCSTVLKAEVLGLIVVVWHKEGMEQVKRSIDATSPVGLKSAKLQTAINRLKTFAAEDQI